MEPTWQGRNINDRDHGRGLVLTDLADRATHTQGRMLVQFANGAQLRKWVDACNCELITKEG